MNEREIVLLFVAAILGGVGTWISQTLINAPKARQEDISNMAAIRKTMQDVLKENTKLQQDIQSLRSEVDDLQKENLELKILVNTLEAQLKELINAKS